MFHFYSLSSSIPHLHFPSSSINVVMTVLFIVLFLGEGLGLSHWIFIFQIQVGSVRCKIISHPRYCTHLRSCMYAGAHVNRFWFSIKLQCEGNVTSLCIRGARTCLRVCVCFREWAWAQITLCVCGGKGKNEST